MDVCSLIFWGSLFTLGSPFLAQKFGLLLVNASGWGLSAYPPPLGGTELPLRPVEPDTARGHEATFLLARGIFWTLKYSQYVLPFLWEAETSRSR